MLTVYGEGRGFRVFWLLEELGLTYRLRPVDLLAVENDRDFLAINPARFILALQDGKTIMVELIAILEYLLARLGSGSLAVAPDDPAFASYLLIPDFRDEAGISRPTAPTESVEDIPTRGTQLSKVMKCGPSATISSAFAFLGGLGGPYGQHRRQRIYRPATPVTALRSSVS